MIHIDQAIIVEGKYDKIKLSSLIDAVIIVTNGFHIFRDPEKMALIRYYANTMGIIILTDSDSAGFKIRNYIKGAIQNGKVYHVYIPDIYGKEKRKDKPSAEGKLGVEGMDRQKLVNAFHNAGILLSESLEKKEKITKFDLYTLGFIGSSNSSLLRKNLQKHLGLPDLLSASSLLEVLNTMMTKQEFEDLAKKMICFDIKQE